MASNPRVDRRERHRDVLDAPRLDLLQRGDGSRQRCEGTLLSHIEASGALHVTVRVVRERREIVGVVAGEPALLEGSRIAEAFRYVHQADAVGSEQPLVSRGDKEVGLDTVHRERHGSKSLRRIHDKDAAIRPTRRAHGLEVDAGAVRPVARRDRHHLDRPSGGLDNGACPVSVCGRGDRDHASSCFLRCASPGQHVAWKLLGDDQNGVAGPQLRFEGAGRRTQAVARRGNHRVAVHIAAEDSRRQSTERLGVVEEARRQTFPGMALRTRALEQSVARLVQLRAVVGGVEVGDVRGHVEQMPLGGEHRHGRYPKAKDPIVIARDPKSRFGPKQSLRDGRLLRPEPSVAGLAMTELGRNGPLSTSFSAMSRSSRSE